MAEQSAALNEVHGAWKGPWYRGMTSGIMTLLIRADGSDVSFTNLEHFGGAPAALRNFAFDGKVIGFRAVGLSTQELEASLNLSSGGKKLRGFATYEGFNLRMELEKQP